jgi:hypothetical protein
MTRQPTTQTPEIAARNESTGVAPLTAAGRLPARRPMTLAELMIARAAARPVWTADLFGW